MYTPFDHIPDAPKLESTDDHQLVLVKNKERFVFQCDPGKEQELLSQLHQLVDDPDNTFTWFDAAVLSHELGQRMSRRFNSEPTQHKKSA